MINEADYIQTPIQKNLETAREVAPNYYLHHLAALFS